MREEDVIVLPDRRLSSRDEAPHPVDLPGEPVFARPLRWTATTIATAAALLLLTNAFSLDGWAAELPPSPIVARLNDATADWLRLTGRAGSATPRAAAHGLWKRAQAARFAGQAPAGPGS